MKNKGFSLVELLAVVIILAVLALITIPFIGNLIKQSRINAAVVSAYGYVETANNEMLGKTTMGIFVDETLYTITNYELDTDQFEVRYEGRGPDKGWFNVVKSKITDGEFCINGYEVSYENGVATYEPDGEYCSPPPRPTICRIKDAKLDYNETDEFEVETIEDLVCLSDLVNNGSTFEGKTITLTKDLDFENARSYKSGSVDTTLIKSSNGAGFTPIGKEVGSNDYRYFKGKFTSLNDNSISNLYINRSTTNSIGFFGAVNTGATIEHITLINPSITGQNYVGGFVGRSIGTPNIRKLFIQGGNVTGRDYVGGILSYSNTLIQTISINGLTVNGRYRVGGVVGYNYGQIEETIVRATVTGTSEEVGGVAGFNENGSSYIKSTLAKVNVTGSNLVGGIAGKQEGYRGWGRIEAILEGGSVTATNGKAGKVIGDASYNASYSGIVYVESSVTRSSSSAYNDGTSYTLSKHYISMYDDIIDTVYGGSSGDYYFDFENDNSDLIVLKNVNNNPLTITLTGSGTESDPYMVATEKDFKDLAVLTKRGYYFKLADNLDISDTTKFKHFYSIGTRDNYFNGHLDGNNKTISNLIMQGGQYSGFIGNSMNATVKDLTIKDSTIQTRYQADQRSGVLVGSASAITADNIKIDNSVVTGWHNLGFLAGYLTSSSSPVVQSNLTNIDIDISGKRLSGGDNVGGIVGYNNGNVSYKNLAVDNITISGGNNVGGIYGSLLSGRSLSEVFFNNPTITGTKYVGGVVGSNNGSISSIQLEGLTLTCGTYSGGLAGYNYGSIEEAIVRGSVTCSGEYAGGIVGENYNGSYTVLKAVLASVDVTGSTSVGAAVGYQNCYRGWVDINVILEGGSVTATSTNGSAGTALGYANYNGGFRGNILHSNLFTVDAANSAINGNGYNLNNPYMALYDDILDTVYGGATGKYYFDFENNNSDKIVLKNINTSPLTVTRTEAGTEADPYILATESDFRDTAILLGKQGAYFRIANNLDISTFDHFYNLGTYNNFFNGHVDGNNKTISNMILNGGRYAGFIGNSIDASINNITIIDSTISVKNNYEQRTGILVGSGVPITANNIKIENCSLGGWLNIGSLAGYITNSTSPNKNSSITNVDINISGKTISGGNYVGGIVGYNNGDVTFTRVIANNVRVTGSDSVGGIYGTLSSNRTVGGFDLNNLTVSGSTDVGGVVGSNGGTVYSININNATISGSSTVGGIVGDNTGFIKESVIRGTVTSSGEICGGVAGYNGKNGITINGVLADVVVTGSTKVGGIVGHQYDYNGAGTIYAVIEGGSIEGTATSSQVGKAVGYDTYNGTYSGNIQVSTSFEVIARTSSHADGTSYSSDYDGDLSYYGSVRYTSSNVSYPIMDSPYTGDINNSGWWFIYDSNGKIKIAKTTDTTPDSVSNIIPSQPVCTENCGTDVIVTETITGTNCPEGVTDTTPPTCEFYGMSPLSNGIMARFSCTDDSGVPDVYSMFNSVVQTTYTAQEILDRTGTQKTGTVSGNTRSVTSRWTTNYSGNKPEVGLCYYYQYTAVDQCGNTTAYVTNFCQTGFSN